MSNEEIKNLVDIIGLKFNQKYDKENIKSLRYGHVMIMADQDSDGSHIVGLLINFIHRESLNHFFSVIYYRTFLLKNCFRCFQIFGQVFCMLKDFFSVLLPLLFA
jgi:5S rRNA maturation endonuclease (ribonuclease M5)